MNIEEHKKRHKELHKALTELLYDWTRNRPISGPRNLLTFFEWSASQTKLPIGEHEIIKEVQDVQSIPIS